MKDGERPLACVVLKLESKGKISKDDILSSLKTSSQNGGYPIYIIS
jgi:NurA-like 5'-3' nuclease